MKKEECCFTIQTMLARTLKRPAPPDSPVGRVAERLASTMNNNHAAGESSSSDIILLLLLLRGPTCPLNRSKPAQDK